MDNSDFYQNLDHIESLNDIARDSSYQALPPNWYILATDVKGSTQAIEQGQYKDINMVGAISIIAILNLNRELDIPFVFGGDGAFVLIPPTLYEPSKQALLAIAQMAKEAYGLELRIGIIPVSDIYQYQQKILITKYKVTKEYFQAIIKGGGLEFCDELLKQDNRYHIDEPRESSFELDLEGLECRWQDIPSPRDEILSILIKAHKDSDYKEILDHIENILGSSQHRHPIVDKKLQLSFQDQHLNTEASLYAHNRWHKAWILFKLKLINLIGKALMDFGVSLWGGYKHRIVSSTDTEKFDDMLRMTVSASFEQSQRLESYLKQKHQEDKLNYGIHKSHASLITCLIFERHGKHIHFVDASKGGYAVAAKMLKEQIKISQE
jgi:hypothetical protein